MCVWTASWIHLCGLRTYASGVHERGSRPKGFGLHLQNDMHCSISCIALRALKRSIRELVRIRISTYKTQLDFECIVNSHSCTLK